MPAPFLGVVFHALGGVAAGSFYIPFKRVKAWSWESSWLVGGIFSWLLAPAIVARLACPELAFVLRHAAPSSLAWTYAFGLLWGVGGLTFGLSMRYLGMSLGYALALGFCAAFGTLIPPLFNGEFLTLLSAASGWITLAGVLVCLAGIAVCGRAGVMREREIPTDRTKSQPTELSFKKGVWVAGFAGVMSACMAFAIAAGKPIATLAIERGTPALWQNTPVFVVILAGGFTTNFLWCVCLNWRHRTAVDYVRAPGGSLAANYVFSALAGITWYLQFLFYGMGTTQMGRYDFSSWTLHMAFIIVVSNLWGFFFREWKGASPATRRRIVAGLLILTFSTIIVGLGNYVAAAKP